MAMIAIVASGKMKRLAMAIAMCAVIAESAWPVGVPQFIQDIVNTHESENGPTPPANILAVAQSLLPKVLKLDMWAYSRSAIQYRSGKSRWYIWSLTHGSWARPLGPGLGPWGWIQINIIENSFSIGFGWPWGIGGGVQVNIYWG